MMKARLSCIFAVLMLVGALAATSSNASPPNAPNAPMADDPSLTDYTVTGPQLALADITSTPLGQQKIAEFVNEPSQYASVCVTRSALNLRAYNLFQAAGITVGSVQPDVLVVVAGFPVTLVRAHYDPLTGQREVYMTLGLSDSGPLAGACGGSGGGGPNWLKLFGDCFARLDGESGWIDACANINMLNNDGSITDDWAQLEMFATAKSKGSAHMRLAYVKSQRAESAPIFQWADWSLRADTQQGNCGSLSLSVAAQGLSISASHTACDMWDITKGAAAADFANAWRGNAVASERETAFMHVVKMAQGTHPAYSIDYGFGTL
jgi:hypothetical protein